MQRTQNRAIVLLTLIAGSLGGMAKDAHATKRCYVDQCVNYSSGNCGGSTVADDTYAMVAAMRSESWTLTEYFDSAAWPQDFWDATKAAGGLDSSYGDNYAVSVFSGHGSAGTFHFSYQHSSACTSTMSTQMLLGAGNGARAGVGIYMACSVLDVASLGSEPYSQRLNQHLGFHTPVSAGLGANLGNFYNDTNSISNTQAWLNNFCGIGEPALAMSVGTNAADCNYVRDTAKVRADVLNNPRGITPGTYCGYLCN